VQNAAALDLDHVQDVGPEAVDHVGHALEMRAGAGGVADVQPTAEPGAVRLANIPRRQVLTRRVAEQLTAARDAVEGTDACDMPASNFDSSAAPIRAGTAVCARRA
jgi:hypothetical protein